MYVTVDTKNIGANCVTVHTYGATVTNKLHILQRQLTDINYLNPV